MLLLRRASAAGVFFLFLLLCQFTPALCRADTGRPCTSAADWQADALDRRNALPNNTAPPARREPLTRLAPLPLDQVGTVRRCIPHDGARVVALTFDLCELDTQTTGCDMAILNFLRTERVPATLFMGGKWMRTHVRRVRQVMTDPLFEIGNHAWSHGNCALLSPQGIRAQAAWTQAQYELLREETLHEARTRGCALSAIAPVPRLFRLPYGRCTDQALEILAEMGFQVIQWDVVAEAVGDNSSPQRVQEVVRRVRPGSILLFHANLVPRGSGVLLQGIVAELRRKGYAFVTVGALLDRGTAQRSRDGYFTFPGDNRALDARFGVDGTGRHTPFTGRQ